MNLDSRGECRPNDSGDGRWRIALVAFIAIAAYFLLTEHRAHLAGYIPLLWLLACALLHVFMHGGHGRHHDSGAPPSSLANSPGHREGREQS